MCISVYLIAIEFQVRVGDITYFTKSYLEILEDKPEFRKTNSVDGKMKQKRAAVRNRRLLWPEGVIAYKFSTYYSGKNNKYMFVWFKIDVYLYRMSRVDCPQPYTCCTDTYTVHACRI